jgi:hypothetical protein
MSMLLHYLYKQIARHVFDQGDAEKRGGSPGTRQLIAFFLFFTTRSVVRRNERQYYGTEHAIALEWWYMGKQRNFWMPYNALFDRMATICV